MPTAQTLKNDAGDTWVVELDESERLTHIGGFLLTHRSFSSITLASQLTPDEKARGIEILLQRLAATPIGRSSSYLWHLDDDPTHDTEDR